MVTPRGPLQLPGWAGYHWYVVPRSAIPIPARSTPPTTVSPPSTTLWGAPASARAHVLGGFSMGSVMSYSLGSGPAVRRRRASWRWPGSSRRSTAGSPTSSRPRVFIAHGRQDPIMEVAFARRARDLLEAGGLPVEYHESDAGHYIEPAHVPRWSTGCARRAARIDSAACETPAATPASRCVRPLPRRAALALPRDGDRPGAADRSSASARPGPARCRAASHRELAAAVADGVEQAGGVPLEFNTIAVSDNQTQGRRACAPRWCRAS